VRIVALVFAVAAAALSARSAVACQPVLPDVRAALDARQFEKAELTARRAISAHPDDATPQISLAQVYIEWAERPDPSGAHAVALDPARASQARELLEKVVARWPGLVHPHVCLIDIHQTRGDMPAFFAALERALSSFPSANVEIVESLEFTVRRFLEDKRIDLANRACEALAPREGATVAMLSNCALARLDAQDLDGALAGFRKARAKDPKDALVAHNLAMVESLSGDLAAAERTLTEQSALEPDRGDVLVRLAVVVTARDPAGSAAAWKRVAAHAQARPNAPESAGALAYANQTLAALSTPDGIGASALVAMARALMEGDAALSVALLRKASALAPGDPSSLYFLGQAFEILGLSRNAYEALRRAAATPVPATAAVEIAPGNIDFETGRVAAGLGRHADALAHLQHARSVRSDFPNLEYLLGLVYEGLGDAGTARREYLACLERPNNAAEYVGWCRKNAARLASAPAAPAPATESFEVALAKARSNESSAAGKGYFAPSTGSLAPRIADAMVACVPSESLGQETLVVRIAADGSVAETLQPPDARAPRCFAARLRGARTDPPPAADWWLWYEIKIQP